MAQRKTIGEILVDNGRFTKADVERALEHQKETGDYFGQALIELEARTDMRVDLALASPGTIRSLIREICSRARDAAAERFGDSELNALLSPSPAEETNEGCESASWSATLNQEGVVVDVDVRVLVGQGGTEYLFRPQKGRKGRDEEFQGMSSAGIVSAR